MMTGPHPPLAKYRMTPPVRVPLAHHWHDFYHGDGDDVDPDDNGDLDLDDEKSLKFYV